MNERIKQLADEADDYTDNKTQMPGEYHPDWHDIRDEKFAQLIINQCIDIIKQQDRIPAGFLYPKSADTHAYEIKQYFGVE